ncbi:hypothetical protein [Streptomyces sp. NPDC051572]|uniref:hypothetical protein n=1 Tax=Streptomyces sp. NPDC051572 TaxID=3155802 RepID=UPI00345054E0
MSTNQQTAAASQHATPTTDPMSADEQTSDRHETADPTHNDALPSAAESCPACQHRKVRAGRCDGCGAAIGAEAAAAALAGMPRNAGVLVREASELGWDVRAERRWTGRLWVRAAVFSGLMMVPAGVEETEHVCAWNESTGKLVASASTGGFKAVREDIKAVRVVSRKQEATGRTVWGRDAAEWVRQMDGAVAKVSAALCDARDAFNALDGSSPTGARAVELASAAYAEAKTAERSAVDAVKAARTWLAETNGDDARGCASWRRAVVLAGQHVKEAGETIADATARAGREALAAPIIEEARERLNAQETQWRKRLAESGREPSARGYAELIVMFEDSSRDWAAWFDGYTDHGGVKHAGQGDSSQSFVAQYDAWGKSKHSDRSVHFPSPYTSASLIAGGRVDAAGLAFTLAVVDRIEGRGAETLRKAAAVRKHPQGFGTANDRKYLADWSKYPHNSYGEPTRLAEHAPAEWAALETAQAAYNGVQDFRNALYWDTYYAGERANARAAADRAGLAGRDDARAERAESGRAASAWAADVERLTTARVRVHEAVVLAAGDVERAQACGDRVRKGDALADDVWSAIRSCEEAYDDVNRAKRDAAHYAESAETYREAGALSGYVAECARMEDAAARAEAGREETLNLYGCTFEDAATVEEDRHAACAALPAVERPAAVAAEVTDFKPWGAGLRLVCACGAVHAPTVPVVDGDGAHVGALVNATDWMINGLLKTAGLRATVGRDQWSRGVLLSSVDGAEACYGWRIPVEAAPVVSHSQGCGSTVADGSEWHATCKPVEPTPAAVVTAADLSSLWGREAVGARTAAIELAPRGVRQPKGSPVTQGSRKGEWECGGRVYAIDRKPKDPAGIRQETPPNTVYDMTPVRDGSAVSASISGHAHGAADGRKLIRHYAREVAALLAEQEKAEAARVAECERIPTPPGRELAEEQQEPTDVMVAEVADASGDLARRMAAEMAAEAASSRDTGGDAGQPEAAAGDDVAAAQLSAALEGGESIAAVSFVDGREPAAGWVLTTAAGHAFRVRPVTHCRPEEDQWEAGHDADGSHWWAANIEDRPLTRVLARIREDSATRTRFAALWAKYGQYTAQAPAFECTPDRVKLEPGVFLVRRFGAVGLVAECRWGYEHLTAADGSEGCTGEDWARKGPDNRRYVAEWKVWSLALEGVANSRLRVISVCADDDTAADADAYCAMSAPYVGKCSAKRSGARYWVSVVTDQGCELGRFVACARCLSGRILDDAHGGGRFSGRDVVDLARDLAKGDPKTCALHWQQWGDRAAELCGQLLTEALENGERAPWPSKALADALIAQGAADGDDRAKREARAAARERGGDKKAQDRAAVLAVDMRAERAALVASVRASRAAFSARLDAESAAKDAERNDVTAALVSDAVATTPAGLVGSGSEGGKATPEAVESRPVLVPDTFAASGRTPLRYDDLDGWTHADFVATHPSEEDAADLVRLAGPGPLRWLFAPAEGDAPRAVNLFGGCGGWCVGIRRILGATVDMLCIDASRDATATATRAGCHAVCADVRSIDPEHPVFRHTQILIGSSPCIDFTNAGNRAGRLPENVATLADAIEQAGTAVGNYIVDGPGCTCVTDEECECGPEAYDHFGPRSGATWDEIRSLVADMPGAETAGLMLEPMIWALALKHSGAPLHTILFEQSNQLPEEIRDVIKEELYCAGESTLGVAVSVTWKEIDAAAYGSPSTRRRAFMMATFGRYNSGPVAPEITITADQATGLSADLEVITRGARKTSGGNAFVMGRVIPGVTSRIRSVDVGRKGGRFTLEQVAALVTLPRDYAALAEGSRTSICRQFADIVAPVVSAAVFGETVGHLFGIKRNRGGWLPLLLAYLREQYPGAEGIPAPEPSAVPEPVAKESQDATFVGACECGRSIERTMDGPVPACPHVEDEPEAVAAGSEAGGSAADRWLDESNARTELPRMGWCVGLADVLAAVYAGDLHADTSGIVRRREGRGRRVRAALIELLASGGYIAVPRAGRRGPVTVTPDGVTAHRWCVAAPDLLHADERAAYRARVRLHHTSRTSKQTARDRARRLTPLPYGAEEKRRRAAQMRQVEQWAKEVQATRERLDSEQAERDAQAEQEQAAEWARIQQEAEERQAAEEDRRDDGLVMSQHGPQEIIMGSGKRRVTVKRINPSIWHATTREAVYVVSNEGGDDWPWLVIAPDNTRIDVCSVINDVPYANSVRDIVRDHADAMERGETFPKWTPPAAVATPEETGQGQPAATDDSDADGQSEQEPVPSGADPEDAERTVTAAEPGACDGYGCTATGPRWKVTYLPTSLLCADHTAERGHVAVADLPAAVDLPKAGQAYNTPAPARAVALDLIGSKWVAECDRHGPVSMGLNKFGDAVADVAAAYVYDNEQDAADAARTHLDAHASEDADVMTPEDIDAAQALNFSRDQWRTLGWMSDGKVRETAAGFTAYDISPDRADVSKKIRKNLIPRLWAAGFVKVFAVAPGVREFGLTDEGERALRMWSNAMRINAVTEPAKDTRHATVKDSPYRWLSAGETWPGEQKKAQAAADAEQAANNQAAALRAAEEKAAAERAATPTADELTVLQALSAECLDAGTAAVLSAAYIGHVVTRHRPGATSVRLDEGTGEDKRRVTRTYNVNGVEKPITPEADDALSAIPANLTDATAETWHALCTSVDERYGVYWLDLAAATEEGAAALALLDQAEQEPEEPAELWGSREFVQAAAPGTEAEVIDWASAGLLWQNGDGFRHAGRTVSASRVLPLIEAQTLYRSADGRVYPTTPARCPEPSPAHC